MKAAVYYETGTPDVLRYEEVPDPAVGPGEVLVKVAFVSIEGGDTLNRLRGEMNHVPHIVGYQCSGVVVALGENVTKFALGDRVVTTGVARRTARSGRSVHLETPRRSVDRGRGVRAGALWHRRRLLVRVRAPRRG